VRWLALVLPWIATLDFFTVGDLPEGAAAVLRRTGVLFALRVPAFVAIVLLAIVLEATVCFFVAPETRVFTGVTVAATD
jgi:hypothetical protein